MKKNFLTAEILTLLVRDCQGASTLQIAKILLKSRFR